MLAISFENGVLGILAILVIGSLVLMHYLLFRDYSRQEKLHMQRLKNFENLVKQEILRSQSLAKSVDSLQEIKSTTDEKLEVIKLQVEGLDSQQKQDIAK
ncbi:hypothetical protein [Algoriphagus litoralis]|uniref:hypothetical protein n=1 Tax=Algoriphagus litoralis TaxID=2202829 RepID=UPI000DB9510C|nr:hypothetical protein [Algoriphagus litoralis]